MSSFPSIKLVRSFLTSAFVQQQPTSRSFITQRLPPYSNKFKVSMLNPLLLLDCTTNSNKYSVVPSSWLSTAATASDLKKNQKKTTFHRYDSLSAMNSQSFDNDEEMGYQMNKPKRTSNNKRSNDTRMMRRDKNSKYPSSSFDNKKPKKQNFLENFRGTRVFVQGIPDHVSWQDLKDHFKVAGEVVFASVSIDPSTGASKGCGIVQFETTEMANTAIQIMRDHPMNDGSVLYVREDYQETKEGQEYTGQQQQQGRNGIGGGGGGGGGGSVLPTKWKCADEANLSLISKDDLLIVRNLIKARDEARIRKNYDTSDLIREDLKKRFSVHIDDRLKLWWVSADNSVPKYVSETKGNGRWGELKPWRQIPTTIENDACVNADLVNGLLAQRDIARKEKDFSNADSLLEEARVSPDGDLTLRIHDESRTWRVWTNEPPPRHASTSMGQAQGQRQGQSNSKRSPAEQCIMIVEKYDPSKVQDVKNLLENFPGREYNILKKLKQNYNV